MKRGRPTTPLVLSDPQRQTLLSWTRRRKSAQALALRAHIVLACASGKSNTDVAHAMRCSLPTVGKWRARFLRAGVDGLLDEARPGAPRKLTDEQVGRVIIKTLKHQPAGATHWSTRSMAQSSGLSQTAISRIWRAFALPWTSRPGKSLGNAIVAIGPRSSASFCRPWRPTYRQNWRCS